MLCYPLAKYGNIIGTPYSGTHTLGNWQSDNAIDLRTPIGTKVIAVENGIISSRIGSLGKGGRFAGLRLTINGEKNSYYYAHLSSLAVRAGQPVHFGQVLGRSGSTGVAHLHFACQNGSPYTAIRSAICPQILWTTKRKWLWLRWWLGEGEFKKYGRKNFKHRPKVLPDRVPREVWVWARDFLAHRYQSQN